MEVYVYQAELFCRECGEHLLTSIVPPEGVDKNNRDESLYDSSDYPKGPYADGGGEADSPQHCGDCGEFLGNPLTPDGVAYVRRALTIYESTGEGRDIVLNIWREHYGLDSHYAEAEDNAEPLEEWEAAELAPQWGSYMNDSDPGAIMYSAIPPEREEHRDAMLRHIRGHLYPVADRYEEEGKESEPGDAKRLRSLAAYLKDLTYDS